MGDPWPGTGCDEAAGDGTRARARRTRSRGTGCVVEAGFCERVEQRGAALDIAHELLLLRGDTLDIVASVRLATPPGTGGGSAGASAVSLALSRPSEGRPGVRLLGRQRGPARPARPNERRRAGGARL